MLIHDNLCLGCQWSQTARPKDRKEYDSMNGGIARELPTSNGSELARETGAPVPRSLLTPREMEVLRLMADGLTTREIGNQLGMRFKTAACHRNRILQKFAVRSTVTAVRSAIRKGLIAL